MRKQPLEEQATAHAANDRAADVAATIQPGHKASTRRPLDVEEDLPHARVRTIAAATGGRVNGSEDPWDDAECRDVPDDALVTSSQVRKRVGSVSAMCLWRWVRDGKFPKPVRINGRNYWQIGVIRAWVMAQVDEAHHRGIDVDCERPAAVRTSPRNVGEGFK